LLPFMSLKDSMAPYASRNTDTAVPALGAVMGAIKRWANDAPKPGGVGQPRADGCGFGWPSSSGVRTDRSPIKSDPMGADSPLPTLQDGTSAILVGSEK
jgi:hypothetical protein